MHAGLVADLVRVRPVGSHMYLNYPVGYGGRRGSESLAYEPLAAIANHSMDQRWLKNLLRSDTSIIVDKFR